MEAKKLLRPLLSALILGASIGFIYNVVADDTELRKQASQIACGENEVIEPWHIGRYPWWQSYGFHCESGSVDVTCTRSLYLVGEYTCTWDAGNAPPSQQRAAESATPGKKAAPKSPAK